MRYRSGNIPNDDSPIRRIVMDRYEMNRSFSFLGAEQRILLPRGPPVPLCGSCDGASGSGEVAGVGTRGVWALRGGSTLLPATTSVVGFRNQPTRDAQAAFYHVQIPP